MNKYLADITSDILIKNAIDVYNQKRQGMTPVLNGVKFDSASELGMCQKNIRQIIEATIWGEEWRWSEAACCASNTCSKIKKAGYESLKWSQAEPGDIIYLGGGKRCKTCGKPVGHVMLYLYDKDDKDDEMMWQNTSYESNSLCIIPIRQSQINRITGVFRLLPQKINDVTKVIDIDTNKILALIDGHYSLMYDHLSDQNKIYLKR